MVSECSLFKPLLLWFSSELSGILARLVMRLSACRESGGGLGSVAYQRQQLQAMKNQVFRRAG